MSIVLGINAYHGDSSACILVDGNLVAAAEEERFRRIKHWAGFPTEAIRYCLEEAKTDVKDIDHIAVNRNPRANFLHKALFAFRRHPNLEMVKNRLRNAFKIKGIKKTLAESFDIDSAELKVQIHCVEHHIAHLASAFMISPYEKAAIVSVDGFGDFVGCMWGIAGDNNLMVKNRIFFPHSLGLFYLALTQYLGFSKYGDEYKVMGLAALGESSEIDKMRHIVQLKSEGQFELNLQYFRHHRSDFKGAGMTWDGREPKLEPVFSEELEEVWGAARKYEEPITDRYKNIAASLQAMYEEAFFHILDHVHKKTGIPNLCLAGGCAMNSVANGKIFDRTSFREVCIQAAAGDAGGALGAAYYVWNQNLNQPRSFVMEKAYWGPQFSDEEVFRVLDSKKQELLDKGCVIEKIERDEALCKRTAREIADGNVVGWFQGRMEWGPRALGNRSIIVDPRRAEMKDVLNARIKKREAFRPFAPSILIERVREYFEKDYPDPFMIKVYPIKPEKRSEIPAVTHVDGTGRLQTVRQEDNPLYWQLIKEFENLTGVPVVLNTSFNENEPIVCTPLEALDCFLRTKMDVLVLGHYMITRDSSAKTVNLV
ncbi:MAG: carbamoyltransferase [Deltaproteobacteria bacterium]|nr:carbamoyltransferase [Deltaproteobacteria bacterium]